METTPVFGLIVLALISGVLFILFAILDIIAIINRKKNRIIVFSVLTVLFLAGLITPLVTMFNRTRNFFKEGLATTQKQAESYSEYGESSIEFEKQLYRDSIKKFSENYESIDAEFFNSYGKAEWFRVPLVYPYSLNMLDELKYASVKNDKNTNYTKGEYDANIIENISYAAFDPKFLLCRVEKVVNSSPDENKGEPDYILFNLKTGKTEKYKNFETMLSSAKKLGYIGREDLVPISEIYYQWF